MSPLRAGLALERLELRVELGADLRRDVGFAAEAEDGADLLVQL